MPGPGSAITFGTIRIPTLVVGFSVSLAAHAGLMATLALVPSGRGQHSASPPVMEFALGEPIRVRLVSQHIIEQPPPDENTDRSTSAPEAPEQMQPIAQMAISTAETPSEREVQTLADELSHYSEPPRARLSTVDWAALVESLRSLEWSSLIASTHRAPAEGLPDQLNGIEEPESPEAPVPWPAVSKNNDRAAPAVSPQHTSHPTREAAGKDTPRGLDQGAAIIDLPHPVYPRRSIRLEQEGTAFVQITVRADGTVQRVRLRTSSGYWLLDNAAIKAARNGWFSPALRDGRPIEAIVVVPFEFKLTTQR